ncbi:MAG TPA: chalcone isomerase family protein [Candidatus Sulfotelmatobacter sp.]|nr:chalcone isomerase family protein [Candidatus Sulfotelmatobacter sp.]
MRTVAAFLFCILSGMTFIPSLYAATLDGVTLPDTVQAANTTLSLNGMGLRTKFMVKVYVAGLYLSQKSSDPGAILKGDVPKRIVMHFVRDVSKNQLTDGFAESFHNNSPDAEKNLKPDIDRLFAALEAVKDGEDITFTYLPDKGTSLTAREQEKLTVTGPAFAEMLFSVWLGPKPPNPGLKKGLLGQ